MPAIYQHDIQQPLKKRMNKVVMRCRWDVSRVRVLAFAKVLGGGVTGVT